MSDVTLQEGVEQPPQLVEESSPQGVEPPLPPKINSTDVFVYRPAPASPVAVEPKSKRPSDGQIYALFIVSAGIATTGVISLMLQFASSDSSIEIAGGFEQLFETTVATAAIGLEKAQDTAVLETSPQASAVESDSVKGRLAVLQSAAVEESVIVHSEESKVGQVIASTIRKSGVLKTKPKLDVEGLSLQIKESAEKYGVNPLLLAALIQTESSFNADAKSGEKVGLLQLKFSLAKELATKRGIELKGADELKDPSLNLDLGVDYFSQLLLRFGGNERQALLAYHWDAAKLEVAIEKNTLSPEDSRKYATRVQKRLQALSAQLAESPGN